MEKNVNNFCLISLGCAKNLVDSDKVVTNLVQNGFQLVEENTTELVALLNTCAFIQPAIEETETVINELIDRKKQGNLKYIIVIGCYPSRLDKEILKKRFPQVDYWCPIKKEKELVKVFKKYISKIKNEKEDKIVERRIIPSIMPDYSAYIKISEGCSNCCSYCTIPRIRGSHKSRSIKEIVAEIEEKIRFGLKEAILVAEDTTLWGTDLYNKPSLPKLLKEISNIESLEWIRIMYAYPSRINQELISIISQEDSICKYLDIPIQHANNMILKSMNRSYSKGDLITLLSNIRKQIPDISLRTSVIVGYPIEDEDSFQELTEFLKKYPFDNLGCFAYSDEKEVQSSGLPDRVDKNTMERRIKVLMDQQYEYLTINNKRKVGKVLKVLYEGNGFGRSYYDAPDIDTNIYIINHKNLQTGNIYSVKIINNKDYDLIGKLC